MLSSNSIINFCLTHLLSYIEKVEDLILGRSYVYGHFQKLICMHPHHMVLWNVKSFCSLERTLSLKALHFHIGVI